MLCFFFCSFLYVYTIHSQILMFYRQLIKIKLSLQAYASDYDYLSLTCFFFKSALLQTNITGISSTANVLICFIHMAIELKESRLSVLYIKMIAIADRQKEGVKFRNLYWPAVSHSCTSTFVCPILITFWPYQSPTVHGIFFLNVPWQKRLRNEVFPTLLSPIRIILTIQSQLSSTLIINI